MREYGGSGTVVTNLRAVILGQMPLNDPCQLILSTQYRLERPGDLVFGLELGNQPIVKGDPSQAKIVVRRLHADFARVRSDAGSLELDDGRRPVGHRTRRVIDIWQAFDEDGLDAGFGYGETRDEADGSGADDEDFAVYLLGLIVRHPGSGSGTVGEGALVFLERIKLF
jgi:hypothetical protein